MHALGEGTHRDPAVPPPAGYQVPEEERLLEAYRRMVVGRRFDRQATALTKQGRLAVYPSSHGQEACQIAGVLALREDDWLFPTYRDSVALVSRGLDPVEVLTLLRGGWHCGYHPAATRVAPLAYKGIGYGIRSEQVDGNDLVAVLSVLTAAVEHARTGGGPFLVEAHTYRMDPQTNADDATRYREKREVEQWEAADPLARLETYLRERGVLDAAAVEAAHEAAEEFAARVREPMNADPEANPFELFEHVFAEATPQLREQRALLAAELED
ncbi:thiamine pyrophosphate-dependent enzyme [Nonomuraea sp. JJY05]|uniref:thiamine pyrophosphate-dependent enzyme n=1 Tax=Nonomuraea sp. JJY05 TaxID=3350255 RepID=UPI00373F25F9